MRAVKNCFTVFKRELKSYFESPVAYVFMVVFLMLVGFMTFSLSGYYERQSADLQPFFFWHPWVYLLLVPAATMSLWAEEQKTGTIELLLTMPVTMLQTILGKFLDPLADKLIVMAALIMLIPLDRVPAWAVFLVLAREMVVTGLRSIASSEGIVIAASDLGKYKTNSGKYSSNRYFFSICHTNSH